MFVDLAIGMVVYTATSYCTGHSFNLLFFIIGLKFAFFPDLDFVPFILLRRRYNLASHHFIHFPLVLPTLGAAFWFFVTGGWYFPAMFFFGTMGHLIHDSFSHGGIRWLWPFSNEHYTFAGWRVAKAVRRKEIIERLTASASHRSAIDEFLMRWEHPTAGSIAFLLTALAFLIIFISS
ncbi:MAG: hypothetical protein A3H69_00935 [Candidatus Sungbacteria bacterium RIFCSPLOWO2_02_FULL_47_9]|uniref:Phospholipase C/D domain-containing protein n=1 Tax=Candidatus Sungbacteria bacterium RIFCSPHIGHO2_01_FULL_47_32 TaxID=1802264 RepID=A0A1G2K8Q0_9BACT|nr:MAG: hypothetical protein UX72_C0004G0038 [Parcubacteria group bacterium GW2011_GWA2_47_10]OGZ95755.1 MAG: hypothetical protein A2633_00465 [Candidatus Sungbacteria bacterium RIFCSPHIGHO2_01_FULL_47_32]OGZ99071.1 MAG: hypothetical protein A3D57_03390 [Candidatus Sungbacteria bacterium RIFCSPHIGHO2_02_FULL_46_12]OHA04562.1 MAG: hypothetical protein A3A28_01210 [Candidatus Sungbacteria bacterium RIFCSPLOWO2_01_FULL_47_32]OHA09605.1 MAG: hypothetical protein A3H69_00935 [Candidatus Sungbacteria